MHVVQKPSHVFKTTLISFCFSDEVSSTVREFSYFAVKIPTQFVKLTFSTACA